MACYIIIYRTKIISFVSKRLIGANVRAGRWPLSWSQYLLMYDCTCWKVACVSLSVPTNVRLYVLGGGLYLGLSTIRHLGLVLIEDGSEELQCLGLNSQC